VDQQEPPETQTGCLQLDPLLSPYLSATDEADSERFAEQLVLVQARPIVQGIIKYKLPVSSEPSSWNRDNQDAEDVYSEVVLELLAWLRKLKADPENNAVKNFRGFAAVLAYRACAAYLRKKHPQRLSLKNKIYYTLTHNAKFALWKDNEDEWLCGFIAWTNCESVPPTDRLRVLLDTPQSFAQAALSATDIRGMSSADLLAAIFGWVGTPIRLDDVVNAVAELWCIKDKTSPTRTMKENSKYQDAGNAATQTSGTTEVEQRAYLQHIWLEIGQLPLAQRCALLLNLTDSPGHGVIALLPIIGIASIREIARTLGMTDEQLSGLWNTLPLDDATIAAHLGVTRQRVINLRKSARERLVRRMRSAEGNRELVFSSARS
jgi:DNA-directed RNA polymerase specialized sigma24 family protein